MRIRLDSLQSWLESEQSEELTQFQKSLSSLYRNASAALDDIRKTCSSLQGKSEKDMLQKKNERAQYRAARAVNRLARELPERIAALVIPDAADYEKAKALASELSRGVDSAIQVRDRWSSQIRPYYILDMMGISSSLDRLRKTEADLNTLVRNYASVFDALKNTGSRAREIRNLQNQLLELENAVANATKQLSELESRERTLRDKMKQADAEPEIQHLTEITRELNELRRRFLTEALRYMSRPFRKLESTAGRGGLSVPPEIREGVTAYLRRPFRTFIAEAKGYPTLRSVLITVRRTASDGKLRLSERKIRKIAERINEVLTGQALNEIYEKAQILLGQRRELGRQSEFRSKFSERQELRKQLAQTLSDEKNWKEKLSDFESRIQNVKSALNEQIVGIQTIVDKATGNKIELEI